MVRGSGRSAATASPIGSSVGATSPSIANASRSASEATAGTAVATEARNVPSAGSTSSAHPKRNAPDIASA